MTEKYFPPGSHCELPLSDETLLAHLLDWRKPPRWTRFIQVMFVRNPRRCRGWFYRRRSEVFSQLEQAVLRPPSFGRSSGRYLYEWLMKNMKNCSPIQQNILIRSLESAHFGDIPVSISFKYHNLQIPNLDNTFNQRFAVEKVLYPGRSCWNHTRVFYNQPVSWNTRTIWFLRNSYKVRVVW